MGQVIQLAGWGQGTGLDLCLHGKHTVSLAHIFIWVAWRGEGTLLSKLPLAAVTDKQADCRRNVSSLPTTFFKSSLVSSEHTYKRMLPKDKYYFTFPDQPFQMLWLQTACSLEPLIMFFFFFFFPQKHKTHCPEETNSWHKTKMNKIYVFKYISIPIRILLLFESEFLMGK